MNMLFKLLDLITKCTVVVVIGAAVCSYYQRDLFSWVKGDAQTMVLGFIMLCMGLSLTKTDLAVLAKHPFDLLVGAVAQYTIMPLAAWGIARGLDLSEGLTLGLILVGTCPGGVSSNIMSFLAKGDVAFSVGMTTISTLLAPVMTPLLTHWLIGQKVPVDGWGMFEFMLYVTLIPVTIGATLNISLQRFGFFRFVKKFMPPLATFGFACIVGGVVAFHGDKFITSGLVIFACIFCHNTAGYILGYLAGVICGMPFAKKKTLAIEVGVQNAGLATGIATKFFPASGEAAVAAAVSCVWHSISGTILANFFQLISSGEERAAARLESKLIAAHKTLAAKYARTHPSA